MVLWHDLRLPARDVVVHVLDILPTRMICIEVRTRLAGGLSRPPLVVTQDEHGQYHEMVLKVRHPDNREDNHFEGTSLACELAVAMLARLLGLRVPDYAIVDVPEALPSAIKNAELRALFERNIGPNFGCIFENGCSTWRTCEVEGTILEELAAVLGFDATVVNGDRKRAKTNLLCRGEELILIDHSLALPVFLWSESTRRESPLLPREEVEEHCAYPSLRGQAVINDNGGERSRFARICDAWGGRVDDDTLDRVRGCIPPRWEQKRGHLDQIFEFLKHRRQRLQDINNQLVEVVG